MIPAESIFSTPVSMLSGVSLPKRIARLADLAYNLWWTWNPDATEIFEAIDRQLWDECGHNPVKFLRRVKRKALNGALQNPQFLELFDRVLGAFDAYLRSDATWHARHPANRPGRLIAYFSTEFGLHECFPTYAGGLGILSGDHAKEASDLGLPFVGVGFLYNQGYFSQRITEDGWQEAGYIRYSFDDVPVIPLLDADDKPIMVAVDLPGRVLHARLWKIQVGRIPLVLLDSDVPQNAPNDRDLTARVYGGDLDTRISQEIVLGIGGVRALEALGVPVRVFHTNEGHAGFLGLERIRTHMQRHGLAFREAVEAVRAGAVFTTHTPVPAGIDQFPRELVEAYFGSWAAECGVTVDELMALGRAHEREHPQLFADLVAQGQPDDVAVILYTSGTTGRPKGVCQTHAAFVASARGGVETDGLKAGDDVLSYLPPAWVGDFLFSMAQWLVAGFTINCPESSDTVGIDMNEIGPTYYFAPPRVFEGLLTSVTIRMEDAGALQAAPARPFHGRGAARRLRSSWTASRWARSTGSLYALGDLLVYGPLRNNLGMSRVRVAYTAGEAIGPDLFSFYRSIGINLKQLYGSTETAVFVCLQPDHEARADTVGVPCRGVEIKVAENGEILVKSPGLLKEYYKNPEATAEVLTDDGWYHTSDAGFIDAHGHLKIIDRVKDVGRLKGGPYDGAMFAPKYVENKLKFFPHIKEAVAFGDRREKVCAFINIDFEAVGNWAERRNLPYAGYTDLAGKPEVYDLVRECVEKVNADLAADPRLAGSQIHRFLVLHKELDADDGELTRTRKVRRGFIADKYQVLIDALYEGREVQHVETQVKFEDGRTGMVAADLRIESAKTFPAATGKAA